MDNEIERNRIIEDADKYGFSVPYDGTSEFYDRSAIKAYIAGATAEYNRAQEEITRLKAELERERELRKEAWNNAIDAVNDMLVVQMEDEENEGLAALEHVYSKLEPLKN